MTPICAHCFVHGDSHWGDSEFSQTQLHLCERYEEVLRWSYGVKCMKQGMLGLSNHIGKVPIASVDNACFVLNKMLLKHRDAGNPAKTFGPTPETRVLP